MAKPVKTATSKSRRGARRKSIRSGILAGRLRAYAHLHGHALVSSLGRLSRTPFSSLMTVIVLAVAVALPSGLYVLVTNVQQVAGNLESGDRISLFMKHEVSDAEGRATARQLRQHPDVDEVQVITKSKALEEFRAFSGFGEALDALSDNPLPVVIQVLPDADAMKRADDIEAFLKELEKIKGVDFVQMDLVWVKRLQAIMQIAERGIGLIGVLLGTGVLLIVGNTIRLELQSRRDEVVISKLVGATNAFIRRPFIYGGFWYGFLGGILAWLIISINLLFLKGPAQALSSLYGSDLHLLFLGFTDSLLLILISTLLGVAGSWLTLLHYLRKLNPE